MSYWSTIQKLRCPKCKEFNFLDVGDVNDLTGFDPDGCICWNCKYSFDFEGDHVDPEEASCDDGERLIEFDDELVRDAESWRWIKEVVAKTGYIDFGGKSNIPAVVGYGYEFCSPADASEYWDEKAGEWKPIGMAWTGKEKPPVDQFHRRKISG